VSVGENGRLVISEVEDTMKDRIVTHDRYGRPSLAFASPTPRPRPHGADLHRRLPGGGAARLRRGDDRPDQDGHRSARRGSLEKLLRAGDTWTVT